MTNPVDPTARLDYQASIDRPCLTLPNGKRVAVFIVVNVENWDIGRAMPRQVLSAPQGASVMPDLPGAHINAATLMIAERIADSITRG